MEDKKKQLFKLLKGKSFHHSPDHPFTLASGKTSPYYINCKPTTNNAAGMTLIGEIIFEMIRDLAVVGIGGLTMGADPLAHATSMISYREGQPINSFCVRKKEKEHGIVKKVEGDVRPGDRVVIVDDVITTGGSTIQAIEAAKHFGLDVVKIIVLVDREEAGGKTAIQKYVPEVDAIFTLSQFKEDLADEESDPRGSVWGQRKEACSGL